MHRWIATLFVLVATFLLLRALAFDSPLMAGDEYAYFAAAQTFPDPSARFAADPYLPRIYSPLFAAYGRGLFALGVRPESLMKALNTLAFLATTVLYVALLPSVAAGRSSLLYVSLLLVTPLSVYTAYFMPESTYALLFASLAFVVVKGLARRTVSTASLAGAIVGAMLLVKPHALALFASIPLTLAFWAAAKRSLRPPLSTLTGACAAFVMSSYLTLIVLNGLLTAQVQLHPLTFVGAIYRPYLSHGASPAAWLQQSHQLLSILGGHVIVLGALLSGAIGVAAGALRRLWQQPADQPGSDDDRRLLVLCCFAAAVALTTVGMTTVFTMVAAQSSPHEHLRIHGRYYSFFLPLFFLIFFAGLARSESADAAADRWLKAAGLFGCAFAGLLLLLHVRRVIYPFDFPEAFVFSSWEGRPRVGLQRVAALTVRYGAVMALVLTYASLTWRGRRVALLYPGLLILLFCASTTGVTAWQHANSLGSLALRADGRAMRQVIPAERRSAGMVIGPEWNGPLAYFLFNFQSSPAVWVRPADTAVRRDEIPAHIGWVILVGPYRLGFTAANPLRTTEITYVDLAAAPAR